MAALRCILQPCNPCHRQHIKKHVTRTSIRPHGCHQLCSITAAGTAPLHRRPDPKPSPGGKQDSSHHWQTAASHYIHLSQAAILGLLLAAGRRSHSTLSALQHKRHVCRTAATRATAALSGENNKEERKPHHAITLHMGTGCTAFSPVSQCGWDSLAGEQQQRSKCCGVTAPTPFSRRYTHRHMHMLAHPCCTQRVAAAAAALSTHNATQATCSTCTAAPTAVATHIPTQTNCWQQQL